MPVIYHITTQTEWDKARENGYYEHPSLKAEGFIHCSEDHQVAGVLERYFAGQTGLVRLVIDTNQLTSRYIQEWSPSTQDTFPHIYGPINASAVIDVVTL